MLLLLLLSISCGWRISCHRRWSLLLRLLSLRDLVASHCLSRRCRLLLLRLLPITLHRTLLRLFLVPLHCRRSLIPPLLLHGPGMSCRLRIMLCRLITWLGRRHRAYTGHLMLLLRPILLLRCVSWLCDYRRYRSSRGWSWHRSLHLLHTGRGSTMSRRHGSRCRYRLGSWHRCRRSRCSSRSYCCSTENVGKLIGARLRGESIAPGHLLLLLLSGWLRSRSSAHGEQVGSISAWSWGCCRLRRHLTESGLSL